MVKFTEMTFWGRGTLLLSTLESMLQADLYLLFMRIAPISRFRKTTGNRSSGSVQVPTNQRASVGRTCSLLRRMNEACKVRLGKQIVYLKIGRDIPNPNPFFIIKDCNLLAVQQSKFCFQSFLKGAENPILRSKTGFKSAQIVATSNYYFRVLINHTT